MKLASTVEIFDPYLETWEKHLTTGVPHPGLCAGACTSLVDSLYWFGGWDGESDYNSLHRLDPITLEWRELQPLNQADGPMRKRGCGMVSLPQDKLAVFGGYGITTGPIQPEAIFAKNTNSICGREWSNELHVFNITEGKWSSPRTTGPRPPPCAYFSFTTINNHQAVLFAGRQLHGRVNDCYFIDFEAMEWTKLERSEGAPWPVGRSAHAACCLNYGEEHPQVLVTGGWDNNENTLQDVWILDINSGRWRELTLPEDVQPRMGHTTTALNLRPGWTQVTMFGGCSKYKKSESGKLDDEQQKLAKTTVLEFESIDCQENPRTTKWSLVDVTDKKNLGSAKRVKKRKKQREFADNVEKCVQKRVAAIEARAQQAEIAARVAQNTLQELEAQERTLEQRFQEAEQKKHDLQIQVEAAENVLQRTQAEKQMLEGALQNLQERKATAEQNAMEQVQTLQQRMQEAKTQIQGLQRRVQVAEHELAKAEKIVEKNKQGARETESDPSWLVTRDEIILTDEELGRGAWAVVKVAKFRATRVASKCLYSQIVSDYNRLLFIREMNMAARVRHPNLLQFIGATLEGELIILTELMPTSVRRELENEYTFSPKQITSISLDMARALNYLHLMHPDPIIHRDISSANVLLEPGPNSSWRAKVSDYGSVNLLQRLRTVTPGNPTYAAPEAENVTLQSPKMDIFSFGVLLVEMCTARFPEVANHEPLIQSIQQPDMVALIRQCLAEDRDARPSASDIITELSGPM